MFLMASQRELAIQKQQRFLARMVFIAGALIFLLAGYFWYARVFTNPNNVFWGMVDNNLKTYGVTRHMAQENPSQGLSQTQDNRLLLGSQNVSQGKVALVQNSQATGNVHVDTEAIGTTSANYVRYTNIDIAKKAADGKQVDFSELENVWAVDNNVPTGQLNLLQSMFGSMGAVPFGHLDASSRQKLVTFMRKSEVYKIDNTTAHKESRGMRQVYVFDVKVDTQKYVASLVLFDKLSGLNRLQDVDPSQFASQSPIPLRMFVDITTRNLVEIGYGTNGIQKEQLGAYGGFVKANIPSQAVPVAELESKLQATLQQ